MSESSDVCLPIDPVCHFEGRVREISPRCSSGWTSPPMQSHLTNIQSFLSSFFPLFSASVCVRPPFSSSSSMQRRRLTVDVQNSLSPSPTVLSPPSSPRADAKSQDGTPNSCWVSLAKLGIVGDVVAAAVVVALLLLLLLLHEIHGHDDEMILNGAL